MGGMLIRFCDIPPISLKTRKTYVLYKNDYYELPQVQLFVDEIRKDAEWRLSSMP